MSAAPRSSRRWLLHSTPRTPGSRACAARCRPSGTELGGRTDRHRLRGARQRRHATSCAPTRGPWGTTTAPRSARHSRSRWGWPRSRCRRSAIRPDRTPECGTIWCASPSASATTPWTRRSDDSARSVAVTALSGRTQAVGAHDSSRSPSSAERRIFLRARLTQNSGSGADGSTVMVNRTRVFSSPSRVRLYSPCWPCCWGVFSASHTIQSGPQWYSSSSVSMDADDRDGDLHVVRPPVGIACRRPRPACAPPTTLAQRRCRRAPP